MNREEEMAQGLTAVTIAIFVFLIVTQTIAVAFLPKTQAFTNLPWTAAFVVVMGLSQYSFAYLLHKGAPISALVPLMAGLIPLALIFIGIFIYRESASFLRIVLLCGACGLVGLANAIR